MIGTAHAWSTPMKKNDHETKMAMTDSYEPPLKKGSVCQVHIEDVSNNVLLVILKNGSVTYRGVLLDQSASAPYGLDRLKRRANEENEKNIDGMTSEDVNRGHENTQHIEESSLSLRQSYQLNLPQENGVGISSPVRAISKPMQDKNIRKRMLRPRHVLCSKCKSYCDDTRDSKSEHDVKINLQKRLSDESESTNQETFSKKLKKETTVSSAETKKDNRPILKISFAPSKEESRDIMTSSVLNCRINESGDKTCHDNVLAHSPSVLLRRIDWNKEHEKSQVETSDKVEFKSTEKEHRHKHKKKHKKHKHKSSLSESSHRHKHKKSMKPRDIAFKHSRRCAKIKTKVSLLPKSCVNLSSPVIHSSVDVLEKSEENSSHSMENYHLNSDIISPPHLDGYSDTESTDTYDFPQEGLNSSDSDGETSSDVIRPLMMRIQTRSVFKSAIPDGRTITVGDIVWGKIHGFPAWPGRVISITVRQRDNGIPISQTAHVSWFGSRTRSHMPLSDLCPFIDDYELKFNKKKKGPYKIAVRQASLAAQQSMPDFSDVDIEG